LEQFFKVRNPIRADQLTLKLLGDVKYTQLLLRANPYILNKPIIPEGTVIKIPKIEQEKEESKGIVLWE